MCCTQNSNSGVIEEVATAFSALAGRLSGLALVAIAAACLPQNGRAATTAYWDANDVAAGAGGPSPAGTWGTDPYWSTSSDGTVATAAWNSGDTAVFSAGTDASGAFTVTLGGTLPTAGGVTFEEGTVTLSSGTLTLNGGGVITVNATKGVIASQVSGSAGLTKAGLGELVLAGANDFIGNLTLQQGTLTLDNDQAASSDAISISNDGASGGAVTLRTTKTLTTLANNIDLGGANGNALDFAPGSGSRLVLNGVISGSHSWSANGAGTITLGGTSANTFPGAVTVAQGTLVVAKDKALGTTLNGTQVHSGATLAFQGGFQYTDSEAVDISGTGVGSVGAINNVSGNNLFDGAVTLNSASSIGAAAGSLGFVGPVSGSYALTKVGTGIIDLFALHNNYTTILVSAGTLGVWSPANAGTGLATISAGTRLEGNGSVPGGITLSGTISPGVSPDTLDSGSQFWDGGATYEWEINSVAGAAGGDAFGHGWDLLNITGGLSIGATPSSKFNLKIISLGIGNAPGAVADFDNTQEYNWTIAATTNGVTGFDAAAFALDDSAFSNDKGGGRFVILTSGNDLVLRFDPKPVITCPANITQANDPSFCSAVVNFTVTATDNGPAPTIVYVPPSGSTFPSGTTTVNCTATDSVGNTDTCSFTVTVNDTEPPTITCPANVTVNAGAGVCYATGVSLGVPGATNDNCGLLTLTNDAPVQFPKGVTAVTWTAVDTSGNVASCVQTVTVNDTEAPTITCPANVTVSSDAGVSYATGVSLGVPGATNDNCGILTVTNDAPAQFPKGITTVTWTAVDTSGNVASCVQTVTVIDTEPPTIMGPANLTDVYTDPTRCSATNVNLGVPVATNDNDGILMVTNNAPLQFPHGTTIVTWTAVDKSGNTGTCTQQVMVNDHEAPAITICATNRILALGANCTATIPDLTGEVRATDNCSASAILTISQSPPAGTIVVGAGVVQLVSLTVKDEALNSTTCTAKLRTEDLTPPTIIAPASVTTNANPGVCYATAVALGSPTTGDNCSVTNVSNNAPAQFPLGQTTVTWAVKDSSGNSATATQTVTVVDTTAPVITCVANKTVEYTVAWNFDPPSAMDACGTNTITVLSTTTNWTCGVAYVATRAWQAVDAFGNSATCTQVVTVVDTTPPVILCPSNLTVACMSPWDFGTPVAADRGLGGVLVYDNSANDRSTRFDSGTNEVGNEIILAGDERYLQGFSYEFWSTNATGPLFEGTNVTVRLRFYANDGTEFNGYPTPGTLLYDSGEFWLGMGTTPRATVVYDEFDLWLYALYPLVDAVPSNFTWTVQFAGLGASDLAGVDLYSPPVIGQSYGDIWLRTDTGWQLRTNPAVALNIAAQASASTNHVAIIVLSTVTNAVPGSGLVMARTWRATDACGNSSECSQTVTVLDNTAPVITLCPTNRSLSVGTNCLLALPDFTGELAATDTCSQVSVSQSPPAGTTVGLGEYLVTFTVSDAASNSANCALTLAVGLPDGANTNVSPVGSISRLSDGAVQVDFTGFPCASYTLRSSSNLTDWEVVTTLVPSMDGTCRFVDAEITNYSARFFRLTKP